MYSIYIANDYKVEYNKEIESYYAKYYNDIKNSNTRGIMYANTTLQSKREKDGHKNWK